MNTIDRGALLIDVIQKLSATRSIDGITQIVRQAARRLVHADGATFVLRENDQCYYIDEDCIEPLWKGRRFPLKTCISGWVMLNGSQAVISNVYEDERIPHDVYRPTFVKSLVMTPIREASPLGAIGTYWASHHEATAEEVEQLQVLANTTSIAIENVNLYNELERRVTQRTRQLQALNEELESFTDSISHDLKAPLRSINTLIGLVIDDSYLSIPEEVRFQLRAIQAETERLSQMVVQLLALAKIAHTELQKEEVDLTELIKAVFERVKNGSRNQSISLKVQDGMRVHADPTLMEVVVENLVSNACKYSAKTNEPKIEVGMTDQDAGKIFFVKDNGVGFDMDKARDLFVAFKRLHSESEFEGHGVGLATVQRILKRHGGDIWAESTLGVGTCFYILLPDDAPARS